MRKRYYVKVVPSTLNTKFAADYFFQLRAIDELRDSQPADGNDEMWLQDLNLITHPRRTVANLIRDRNAIRAGGIFSGKTPTDRCEINLRSNCGLIHPAEFFEPPEKSFTCGMREWPL